MQASAVPLDRGGSQLLQPLLMAPADVEGQAVVEGGQQQPEQAAAQGEKRRGEARAAIATATVWRATIPGTAGELRCAVCAVM